MLELLLFLALLLSIYLLAAWSLFAALGDDRPGDRRAAEARAAALLEDLLTEDEYHQLQRCGYLGVPSPSRPGRTYRVPRRGQVRVYEGGALVMTLCVGPVGWLPDGDLVLLHKLMIEGDEAEYLRVANRFTPTGRQLGWPGAPSEAAPPEVPGSRAWPAEAGRSPFAEYQLAAAMHDLASAIREQRRR